MLARRVALGKTSWGERNSPKIVYNTPIMIVEWVVAQEDMAVLPADSR